MLTSCRAGIVLAFATAAGMFGRVIWGALADVTRRPLSSRGPRYDYDAGGRMAAAQPGWPAAACMPSPCAGRHAIGWNGVFTPSARAGRRRPGRRSSRHVVFRLSVRCLAVDFPPFYATNADPAGFAIMAAAWPALAIAHLLRPRRAVVSELLLHAPVC
jgi:hypothetical protein